MRRGTCLLLLVGCLIVLPGCWNRRELNDLALVVAMSVDKSGDGYQVTVQVVDPGEVASVKGGGSERSPVTTYTETGEHLFEAIRKMTTIAPRKLYFSHMQMFIISEEVAKDGIGRPLELLSRDHEFRKDFFVVVTKKIKAMEVLMNLTSLEKIPANKMRSSLRTSERVWAPSVAVPLDDLISDLSNEGKNPVLTGITIKGDKSKAGTSENVERVRSMARLQYEGIAAFNKDKLVGWLDETESKGYNYLKNNVRSTVGKLNCPDGGDMAIEVMRSKTDVKGRMENGIPAFDVHIFSEVNIGEVSCKIDLTDPESIRKLEQIADETVRGIVESAIQKAKKLKVDLFGFGDVIHRADPQTWKTIKKEWNDYFEKAKVTVRTDINIRRTGTVNRSLIDREKE